MNNKHNASDLLQMQALPLSAKIAMTKFRIKDWYEYWDGNVYVSRSGGKDSDVLGHIVKGMYPDVPHIFVNTGLEHNSVRIHGTEVADEILTPQKNFVQILTEYGYPVISKEIAHKISDLRSAEAHGRESYAKKQFEGTYVSKNGRTNLIDVQQWSWLTESPFRISHKCCDYSKKLPAKQYEHETGRKPFIGTLAEESMLRYKKWMKFGCNAFDQDRPTSQPLSFWTEQDILQYIKINRLSLASVYGDVMYTDEDGFFYENPFVTDGLRLSTTAANRSGCVFCGFGIAYDTDRFIRLKETDRKKYDFVMNGGCFDAEDMWIPGKDENGVYGLGYRFVIDWLNTHGNLNIKY